MSFDIHPTWNTTFEYWATSPSASELERMRIADAKVKDAVNNSQFSNIRRARVFTQGSYRNRVNIRNESDVDLGVIYPHTFLYDLPFGKSLADYGYGTSDYSYDTFKTELFLTMRNYFGSTDVKRGNKAIFIKSASYDIDADVTALFEYRDLSGSYGGTSGVALRADNTQTKIVNFPERVLDTWPNTPLRYEKGVFKNEATLKRYKKVVRVLKHVLTFLIEEKVLPKDYLPRYFVECLVFNCPNQLFDRPAVTDTVPNVISYCRNAYKSDFSEADGIKTLFTSSNTWSIEKANVFLELAKARLQLQK